MLKGAEEGVGGAGEVRVTFIPGAPFSDVVWNGKPWTTEGGGWKLHSWATDLSGAHKPSGAPKDQGKGFGFMEIREVLLIITTDTFLSKFCWFTQMSPKEPLVKEKLT